MSKVPDVLHEAYAPLVYRIFEEVCDPSANVCKNGPGVTTVVVGTVVYSVGVTVVNIISFATGTFAKLGNPNGADVSPLIA